jgi:hypothetical protein
MGGLKPTPPFAEESQMGGLKPTLPFAEQSQMGGLKPTPPFAERSQMGGLKPTPPLAKRSQMGAGAGWSRIFWGSFGGAESYRNGARMMPIGVLSLQVSLNK